MQMNTKKYKRDPYSRALILSDTCLVDEFLAAQRVVFETACMKLEIHTLKEKIDEISKYLSLKTMSNQCQ